MRSLRASTYRKRLGGRQAHGPCQFLRSQTLVTDFYSYFCIYLFCLCRGMSEPLLPKAITDWREPTFTRASLVLPYVQKQNIHRYKRSTS